MTVNTEDTNVWIGSETGLLKAIDLNKKLATNHFEEEKYGRDFELKTLKWSATDKNILYGCHKNGIISEFNTNGKYQNFINIPRFENQLKMVDIHHLKNGQFASCTACGEFLLWDKGNDNPIVKREIAVGDDVIAMKFNPDDDNLFASGGKENSLKLWDVEQNKNIFKAKNMPDDWLQLRVPQWITGVEFVKGTKEIITSTGLGKIQLYDVSTSRRRPCLELNLDEYPVTALTLVPGTRKIIAADTRGTMAMLDCRSKKLLLKYKGIAGSIRDIKCHSTLPYVASCGLDRHLRVHHIQTRELEHKVYLKSRLNCLLLSDVLFDGASSKENEVKVKRKVESDNEAESEDDPIWNNMVNAEEESNNTTTCIKNLSSHNVKSKRRKNVT